MIKTINKQLKIAVVLEIQAEINRESELIKRHEMVAGFIELNEGKPVSKRIETWLNNKYPDYCFRFEKMSSLVHVIVWKGDMRNESRHLIAYNDEPFYKLGSFDDIHSGFRYYDNASGKAAINRNIKRKAFIDEKGDVTALCAAFLASREAIKIYDSLLAKTECEFILKEALDNIAWSYERSVRND